MKLLTYVSVLIISIVLSGKVLAQDCGFYSLKKGMVLGHQILDAKGKLTGTIRTTCMDVDKIGKAVNFKLKNEYADGKSNNQSTREYDMKCEDGNFYLDMNSMVDPKSMEAFKGMEVKVDANDMMYPAILEVGSALPDANINLSAGSGGVSIMNLTIAITNRKVVGKESVTVPAGTFDCYKITYDIETKMMFKMINTVTEYVNMGLGSVKTVTFDKKGKIINTVLLNELKK
jgi:hypothetical protein